MSRRRSRSGLALRRGGRPAVRASPDSTTAVAVIDTRQRQRDIDRRSRCTTRSRPSVLDGQAVSLRRVRPHLVERRGERAPAVTSSATSTGLAWDLGDPDGEVTSTTPCPINLAALITAVPSLFGRPISTAVRRHLRAAPHERPDGDADAARHGRTPARCTGAATAPVGVFGTGAFEHRCCRSTTSTGRLHRPARARQTMISSSNDDERLHAVRAHPHPAARTPMRNLDNSLTADSAGGASISTPARAAPMAWPATSPVPRISASPAKECHTGWIPARRLLRYRTADASFENEEQIMKIPHLRNLYQKVGMFGMPDGGFLQQAATTRTRATRCAAPAFLHDGSTDTIFRFFQATVFNNLQNGVGFGFDSGDRSAPRHGAVHARLRHRPGADRRAAGHPRFGGHGSQHPHRASGIMETQRPQTAFTSKRSWEAPSRSATSIAKARPSAGEQRGYLWVPERRPATFTCRTSAADPPMTSCSTDLRNLAASRPGRR